MFSFHVFWDRFLVGFSYYWRYTAYKFLLVDGVVGFYILVDFLFSCFINCWEKAINISNYVYLTSYSFSSISFLLYRFCSSVVWCIHKYPVWGSLSFLNLDFMFLVKVDMFSVIIYLFGNLSSLSSSSSSLETPMI